jgi:hypothetical protein
MTSDGKWPMCGRPDEYACERCQQLGKRCYCEDEVER